MGKNDQKYIAIIDYGMGNLRSVQNALTQLNVHSLITSSAEDILQADKLILPGVGAFHQAIKNIESRGLYTPLQKAVLELKKPILGICLGMQLLAEKGVEGGEINGLGWITGRVERFMQSHLKIPHIGFNTTHILQHHRTLFDGMKKDVDFYYVHSYRVVGCEKTDITSVTEYGETFISSVQKGNIYGTQFHPEKSQSNGLHVLDNFIKRS